MKPIRTRNDIFAAINCRMAEVEENRYEPKYNNAIDCLITCGAYVIRAIEGNIRRKHNAT